MLTGELRNQIDGIWNDFWSGGLSNPLQVIEQITYLIFIKRLDEMQELEERKATTLGKPIERRIFPEGKGRSEASLRELALVALQAFRRPGDVRIVDEHVFPFIRELNGEGPAYARHMRDARFQIPGPALLAKVVESSTSSTWATAIPRATSTSTCWRRSPPPARTASSAHRATSSRLMVELVAPKPEDVICDPACGTCGFLVAAGEYLRKHHAALFQDDKLRRHFNDGLFNGFDFDPTMLRIGSMNMALHGVEGAECQLSRQPRRGPCRGCGQYSLVLANPRSPARSTTRPRPRICCASSRPKRPSFCSWRCSYGSCGPAGALPSVPMRVKTRIAVETPA